MEIKIVNNVAGAIKKLEEAKKKTNFYISYALNKTALDVQKNATDELQGRFSLRTNWWMPGTKYGVNAKFSSKTNLTAMVQSQAEWLKRLDEGGEKKISGKRVAIPSDYIRGGKNKRFPSSRKARNIFGSSGVFKIELDHGAVLIRRLKKTKETRLLFVFKPETTTNPKYAFTRNGQKLADAVFPVHFANAMKQFPPW